MVNENGGSQEDFQEDFRDGSQKDFRVNFWGLCVRVALLYGLLVIFFVVVIVAGAPKLSGLSPLVFVALMFALLPDFREDSLYFLKRLLRK